jgi:hypothetical protein
VCRRACAFAILVLCSATPCFADEPSTVDTPRADALSEMRQRFRVGLEHYEAGRIAEAIVSWDAIYRELGAENGYRLAWNLARAFDTRGGAGDATRAAEYYAAFLTQVSARRSRGASIEPAVAKEEAEATARLDALVSTKVGRIRVNASESPVLVRIDDGETRVAGFTMYVVPGRSYTLRFATDPTPTVVTASAKPGELVEISAPRIAPLPSLSVPPPLPPRTTPEASRPFSPAVLYIAGGAALASTLVPALTYSHALSIKSEYDDASRPYDERVRLGDDYTTARSTAYASITVPALLTAGVLVLTAIYFTSKRDAAPQAAQTSFPMPYLRR